MRKWLQGLKVWLSRRQSDEWSAIWELETRILALRAEVEVLRATGANSEQLRDRVTALEDGTYWIREGQEVLRKFLVGAGALRLNDELVDGAKKALLKGFQEVWREPMLFTGYYLPKDAKETLARWARLKEKTEWWRQVRKGKA